MSAMPQTPKLMIKTPITTAMTILPSQFDEAFRIPRSMGPTCFAGGEPDDTQGGFGPNTATGRLPELITHHKVAVRPPQPRFAPATSGSPPRPRLQPRLRRPFEAVNGRSRYLEL